MAMSEQFNEMLALAEANRDTFATLGAFAE